MDLLARVWLVSSMNDSESTGALSQTIGGVIGVSLALPFLGDPVTAQYVQSAVTPGATEAVQRLVVGPVLDRLRTRNLTAVVGIAAQATGRDTLFVAEQINADPSVSRSFVAVARAAELTDSSEKLKALGETLALLIKDQAQVDEETWFIRQLAPIENYHMRVLASWILTETEWAGIMRRNGDSVGNRQVLVWSRPELDENTGLAMAGELADELVRLGYLMHIDPTETPVIDTGYVYEEEPMHLRPVGGGNTAWALSALGTKLLDRVGGSIPWVGGGRRSTGLRAE